MLTDDDLARIEATTKEAQEAAQGGWLYTEELVDLDGTLALVSELRDARAELERLRLGPHHVERARGLGGRPGLRRQPGGGIHRRGRRGPCVDHP